MNKKILKLVLTGALTALVIVLQLISSMIKFGPFSITLAFIPIVIGAAICGPLVGGWLGLVFGLVVLLSGDAAWFMEYNPAGTVVTVLVKGMAAGGVAGLIFKAFEKKRPTLGAIISSVAAPILNTGVFIAGCLIFFRGLTGPLKVILVEIVGVNFFVELAAALLLIPVVVRVLYAWTNDRHRKKDRK